jgi:hypothetical protein
MTAAVTPTSVTLSRQSTAVRRLAIRLVVSHVDPVPRPRRPLLVVPVAPAGLTPAGAHRRVDKRVVRGVLHLIRAIPPLVHAVLLPIRAVLGPIHVVQLSALVIRGSPLNAIGTLPRVPTEARATAVYQRAMTGIRLLVNRVTERRVVSVRLPVVQIAARP